MDGKIYLKLTAAEALEWDAIDDEKLYEGTFRDPVASPPLELKTFSTSYKTIKKKSSPANNSKSVKSYVFDASLMGTRKADWLGFLSGRQDPQAQTIHSLIDDDPTTILTLDESRLTLFGRSLLQEIFGNYYQRGKLTIIQPVRGDLSLRLLAFTGFVERRFKNDIHVQVMEALFGDIQTYTLYNIAKKNAEKKETLSPTDVYSFSNWFSRDHEAMTQAVARIYSYPDASSKAILWSLVYFGQTLGSGIGSLAGALIDMPLVLPGIGMTALRGNMDDAADMMMRPWKEMKEFSDLPQVIDRSICGGMQSVDFGTGLMPIYGIAKFLMELVIFPVKAGWKMGGITRDIVFHNQPLEKAVTTRMISIYDDLAGMIGSGSAKPWQAQMGDAFSAGLMFLTGRKVYVKSPTGRIRHIQAELLPTDKVFLKDQQLARVWAQHLVLFKRGPKNKLQGWFLKLNGFHDKYSYQGYMNKTPKTTIGKEKVIGERQSNGWAYFGQSFGRQQGRVYFSIRATHVQDLIVELNRLIEQVLGKKESGIEFKVLEDTLGLGRADGAVLYFVPELEAVVYQALVNSRIPQNPHWFRRNRPLLTSQLLDQSKKPIRGISFAMEPKQFSGKSQSYGEMISKEIHTPLRNGDYAAVVRCLRDTLCIDLQRPGFYTFADYSKSQFPTFFDHTRFTAPG